jgi:hypothetical protein
MNRIKLVLFILFCVLINACDLERDNPLDGNSSSQSSIGYEKYSVYTDSNGDKIINKGETVSLQVWLKNIGSIAKGVKATFSTTSSYVSGFLPAGQIDYGNISAGSPKCVDYNGKNSYQDYTIKFKVSNVTPANTQIPINIAITDESGNTWTDSFNVTVIATNAQIVYDKYTIDSDSNGDKIINKGETVHLAVYLKNIGTSRADGVKAIFSTSSIYVSNLSPTTQVNYGNISAGDSKLDINGHSYIGPYTISFKVSNDTPANTQIPINIAITDESGNTWTDSFTVTVY